MEELPDSLRAELQQRFPAYRVPGPSDRTGGWTSDSDQGEPPFICRGDFDGDGEEELATFILTQGGWRLVAADHGPVGYVLQVLDRFPGRDEALTKANPAQGFRLRTLEAGAALVVDGSTFEPSRHPFDSIVLVLASEPNTLMHYRWRSRHNTYVATAFGSLTD